MKDKTWRRLHQQAGVLEEEKYKGSRLLHLLIHDPELKKAFILKRRIQNLPGAGVKRHKGSDHPLHFWVESRMAKTFFLPLNSFFLKSKILD